MDQTWRTLWCAEVSWCRLSSMEHSRWRQLDERMPMIENQWRCRRKFWCHVSRLVVNVPSAVFTRQGGSLQILCVGVPSAPGCCLKRYVIRIINCNDNLVYMMKLFRLVRVFCSNKSQCKCRELISEVYSVAGIKSGFFCLKPFVPF